MNKKNTLITIGVVVIIIVAVGTWTIMHLKSGPGTTATTTPATSTPITVGDFKNATYTIDDQQVTLVNGVSEVPAAPGSATVVTTRYFGNEAVGDVNGDGKDDVAFIMVQNGGGTGTFYYAVVALKTATGYTGTNGVFLGDRIAPQPTEIRNGTVIVNYADRKDGEPMTAQPSVGKSDYLVVKNGALVETPIFVEAPTPGTTVSSPMTVTGVARGNWYFEASFPLILKDQNGKVLAQVPAQAQSDWMTTDYVRFSGTLKFTKPAAGTHGTLTVKKDNPSGLPEHDDSRSIQVNF